MLDAETEDFSRAETLTHANVCCHAKALLIQALDISELVLTDCATRRGALTTCWNPKADSAFSFNLTCRTTTQPVRVSA